MFREVCPRAAGSAGAAPGVWCFGYKKLPENLYHDSKFTIARRCFILFFHRRRWASPLCLINSAAGLASRGHENVQFIDVTGEQVLSERAGLWVVAIRNIEKGQELLEKYSC